MAIGNAIANPTISMPAISNTFAILKMKPPTAALSRFIGAAECRFARKLRSPPVEPIVKASIREIPKIPMA